MMFLLLKLVEYFKLCGEEGEMKGTGPIAEPSPKRRTLGCNLLMITKIAITPHTNTVGINKIVINSP
jgi:hypothetical protein